MTDPFAAPCEEGVREKLARDLYSRDVLDLREASALARLPPETFLSRLADHASARLNVPPGRPLLSVVMPAYNEAATVLPALARVLECPLHLEAIVIDDGSTDGTTELLRNEADGRDPRVRILYQERNRGKGAALRRGFAAARGAIILVQDADLEYDPRDYPALLEPILSDRADVVYGSRFLGGPHRVLYFWHSVGNRFLTGLSNLFTDLNLTDMETCYKAFRREVIQELPLRQNRFGFEPEVTAKVARRRWRIYEVPISYAGRSYAEGKKIGWKDGVHAIWCILRYSWAD